MSIIVTLLQESSMSNVLTMPTKLPIQKFMSYNKLSSSYKKFLLTSTFKPLFYHHPVPFKEWHDAMTDELKATETKLDLVGCSSFSLLF